MTTVINDNFRLYNLQSFINSLNNGNSLYLGIGRPQVWGSPDVPPTPTNSLATVDTDWEDMIAMKRLTSSDVVTGIPKIVWSPNTKYDAYRHDWGTSGRTSVYSSTSPTSLATAYYNVMNANGDIFICIKQKVIAGVVQPSLYSPETGTVLSAGAGIYKTADGYYWKFIANTTTADTVKFQTTLYTPVRTMTVAASPTDQNYNQWLSQQSSASYKRGIYAINVTGAGTGYNGGAAGTTTQADAALQVVGNGSGLQYSVTYTSGGAISDIEITNPGSGYSYASITTTSGTGASFDIIFTPAYGLGCDPVQDLQGLYLLANTRLQGADGSGDFTVANDYRKISLVANPTNYGTSTIATATTLDTSTRLTLTGVANGSNAFGADGIITDLTTNAKAVTVDWNSTTNVLRVISTRDAYTTYTYSNQQFSVGHSVSTTVGTPTGTANGSVASIIYPEVQPFSGQVVYSEYRTPTMRSGTQSENITIVVEF